MHHKPANMLSLLVSALALCEPTDLTEWGGLLQVTGTCPDTPPAARMQKGLQ